MLQSPIPQTALSLNIIFSVNVSTLIRPDRLLQHIRNKLGLTQLQKLAHQDWIGYNTILEIDTMISTSKTCSREEDYPILISILAIFLANVRDLNTIQETGFTFVGYNLVHCFL